MDAKHAAVRDRELFRGAHTSEKMLLAAVWVLLMVHEIRRLKQVEMGKFFLRFSIRFRIQPVNVGILKRRQGIFFNLI